MKEFLEKNRKYFLYLLAGLLLLVFSAAFTTPDQGESNGVETEFKTMLQKVEGVGYAEVMLNKTSDNNIDGVMVVAEGTKDPAVKKQIIDAASIVFGVSPHKIQVFEMNKEEQT